MMAQPEQRFERPFIDSSWVETEPQEAIEVTDLTVDEPFAQVAAAGPEQADAALAAADNATAMMRETTVVQRAAWLERVAKGIRERKDELTDVIVREAGKPISSARSEVDSAAVRFDRGAEEARNLTGEYRAGSTSGHEGWEAIVKPEPVGTVLCIEPYNYPLATPALHVAPALAAGNSVVLKPASSTPVATAILAAVVADLDPPDGAFNYVPGHGSDIGDLLAGDERVNTIAMTGSSEAGEHVARQAGLVHLHMELGGDAPAVVFPDADLDETAAACVEGTLKYAGQRCSAVSRVLTHRDVHDDLVRKLDAEMGTWTTGDLFDEDTDYGPLIDDERAEQVEELVDDALNRGAELVRGGERDGTFFEPTLLANVPQDARIIYEEQFGPVAPVMTFESEDEALVIANGSDLALDGCVFTNDHDRAQRVANRLNAGAVRINGAPSHGLGDIPFGGNKASGINREGIDASIHAMLRTKSVIL
jgi:glyceraldehyde-3-phosphate dehydrogenase [NAD(P)+]